jgi:general secretion pathway protein B
MDSVGPTVLAPVHDADGAASARATPKATAVTPAPEPTGTVFAPADLPESVRAQIPALKISGATYSTNPIYRMAIVNGQVLHEGDLAAPDLQLERIEPNRTVWSFRGYRYAITSQ